MYRDIEIISIKTEPQSADLKEIKFVGSRNLGTLEKTQEFVEARHEFSIKNSSRGLHDDAIKKLDLLSVHVAALCFEFIERQITERDLNHQELVYTPDNRDWISEEFKDVYCTGIEHKDGLFRLRGSHNRFGQFVEVVTPWMSPYDEDQYTHSEHLSDLVFGMNSEVVDYLTGKKFRGSEFVQLNIWDGSFVVTTKQGG